MKNWKHLLKINLYPIILGGLVFLFFYPFFLFGKIPLPGDTIVGMYYPWRNIVWDNYTSGVPFKNFLITDPVRQQYVWRGLAIEEMKKGHLPLWNPYSFSGTPLLANMQSAVFYPFNFVFFLLPFSVAWGLLVVMQPLLSGLFLYLYLRHFLVSKEASILGSFTFAFSGFSITWLEWNTIGHVMLWLPLTLLSIEKIILFERVRPLGHFWPLIFIFSLTSSFFAGHLQVFFYSFLFTLIYLIARILTFQNKQKIILLFVICFLLFVSIAAIQWVPTFQFIGESAREFDQGSWMREGWFLPWQNLIQFVAPDFFGNPATFNYWGIWNYGEFVGYIGILPLLFALYALFFRKDKKTRFFGIVTFFSFLFVLPTPLAKLPYELNIPFLSTSQPTRILSIIVFCLSLLASLGFDFWIKERGKKKIILIYILLFVFLGIGWFFTIQPHLFSLNISPDHILIAKRNLILPSMIVILAFVLTILFLILRQKLFKFFILCSLFFVLIFDLFRFGWKFISFSPSHWIFPKTETTRFIQENTDFSRILSRDRRIFPPNFSLAYQFFDVAGYDPLYIKRYGQLVAAWEREKPDISPAAFNRIITPMQFDNFITDLLGVKYILTQEPIQSEKLILKGKEGDTHIYKNKNVFPRVFLVENIVVRKDDQSVIEDMFRLGENLRYTAVVKDNIDIDPQKVTENEYAEIVAYAPNEVTIRAKSDVKRLLLLTDIYYPAWKAYVDGNQTRIYESDLTFRGIVVGPGEHTIVFRIGLL